LYKINRTKRDMPDPCTQRKGSERRADAEDVSLLMNVLMKSRNCGCEIHGLGCFAAVAQSLGFDATRIIIQRRLLRYSSASDYMKKSLSNLEETLRRLISPFAVATCFGLRGWGGGGLVAVGVCVGV
jgi:hypothetical protein